jgi:beta-glucosidase
MNNQGPFLWGAATSAFQIEGAARDLGKGPSIWDVFVETPGRTTTGDTGARTCDHVRRYREDVALMRQLNLQAYRLSISWPRVLPGGRGAVNEAGLDFYDRLIDALLAADIVPFVTLYHWDLPAALQMELAGWEHPDLPRIFADYATLMFDRLGDRVEYWMTLNEPWCVVDGGYFAGVHAPGIQDRARGFRAGHQLLRAHACAVAAYRAGRNNSGAISLALNSDFNYPASSSPADRAAAEQAMLDFAGWFGDPVYFGDYPTEMRAAYGELLPPFSDEDQRLLIGSMDYLAVNYYTSQIARHDDTHPMGYTKQPDPARALTETGWAIVPEGLGDLLGWLHNRYDGPAMVITENGVALPDRVEADGSVNDVERIAYLRDHFASARRAMDAGVDLRGYLVWSLMDNLEWSYGFSKRFGLIRCDFESQQRTIKASGQWYADWIAGGGWSQLGTRPATAVVSVRED